MHNIKKINCAMYIAALLYITPVHLHAQWDSSSCWKDVCGAVFGTVCALAATGLVIHCVDALCAPSCETVISNCQLHINNYSCNYHAILSDMLYNPALIDHYILQDTYAQYPFIAYKEQLERNIATIESDMRATRNWMSKLDKKQYYEPLTCQEIAARNQLCTIQQLQQDILYKLQTLLCHIKASARYHQEEQYQQKQLYQQQLERARKEEKKWQRAYERAEYELEKCERHCRKAHKHCFCY